MFIKFIRASVYIAVVYVMYQAHKGINVGYYAALRNASIVLALTYIYELTTESKLYKDFKIFKERRK